MRQFRSSVRDRGWDKADEKIEKSDNEINHETSKGHYGSNKNQRKENNSDENNHDGVEEVSDISQDDESENESGDDTTAIYIPHIFPFLQLPGEIRNLIYGCYFASLKIPIEEDDWESGDDIDAQMVPEDGGLFKTLFDSCTKLFLVSSHVHDEARPYFYGSALLELDFVIPGEDVLRQVIDHAPRNFITGFHGSFDVGSGDPGFRPYLDFELVYLLDIVAKEFGFSCMQSLTSSKKEWVKVLEDNTEDYDDVHAENNEDDERDGVVYKCVLEIPREDIDRPGHSKVFLRLEWELESIAWYTGNADSKGWLTLNGALGELNCLDDLAGTAFGKTVYLL